MVIVMSSQATQQEVDRVVGRIREAGLQAHVSCGEFKTIIGVIGDKKIISALPIEAFCGVEKTVPITSSYKLVSRGFQVDRRIVDVAGVKIGDGSLVVMAGPCAVESLEQLLGCAEVVKQSGAQFLRGGAFKPRTSPYSFQGLDKTGLEYLAEAGKVTGLKIVTEVIDVASLELAAGYVDMVQIGARNMQNFQLLRAVGKLGKPVLLKRGLAATIEEWLNAAEYIVSEGNFDVVLCERGIRTFEEYTRNTLDLSAVSAVQHLSNLPIIVDPSHGTGKWRLVQPMSMAAVAAGADGLMVEMHTNPAEALSDGPQSLNPANFLQLMNDVAELKSFLQGRLIK